LLWKESATLKPSNMARRIAHIACPYSLSSLRQFAGHSQAHPRAILTSPDCLTFSLAFTNWSSWCTYTYIYIYACL